MAEPLSSLIRPEMGPSLPSLARLAPPPPLNLIAAEIESRSGPGDVVVDLHGRGGWIARTALARLRRAYDFETTALGHLLAEVVLRPPDLRHFDAAVNALAAQPHGDLDVRQALNGLWASRCPVCGRGVIVDEFIWDGAADAPSRKTYRCNGCRDLPGGGQRSVPADEADAQLVAAEHGQGAARALLLERFPTVGDPEATLPDELLDLYTPRSLVALEAILREIEAGLRAAPIEAALRLALLHVLLPASRLNSYPGRVGALRVNHGHVRPPGERQWRERNPWLLFEDGCRLVRGFIQRLDALPGGVVQARLGFDLDSLADGSANVVLRQGAVGAPGNLVPGDLRSEARARTRLVLAQPPVSWNAEGLAFAYLASALVLGSDAAASLPLEPLFGAPPRSEWGWVAAGTRRSLAAVAPILARDARIVMLLDPGGPEGLVAGVLGGVGAGYRLTGALLAETGEEIGGTLEFVPPGAPRAEGPRTRANVPLPELEEVGRPFRLADVEQAVTEVAVEVLQARGEPARFERLLGEVLVGLDRRGLLRRLVGTRTFGETEARSERAAEASGLLAGPPDEATSERDAGPERSAPSQMIEGTEMPAAGRQMRNEGPPPATGAEPEDASSTAGPRRRGASTRGSARGGAPGLGDSPAVSGGADHVGLLLELVNGELRRADHPRLVELEPGRWWLRHPEDVAAAALPLADRVEWAVFSLLSTSGGLSEAAFFDRIAGMFQGHDAPDESLVRACLESYRSLASTPELLRTNDDLQARSREHSELIGLLVEYGHRLGLRCWIGAAELRRLYHGRPLAALLSEVEQRAYLPLISRGAEDALVATDTIWYLRNHATMLFEVEWTGMLGEALLRRGPRIPTDDTVVRFLVVVPERVELVRFKLARSPLLRAALEAGNWHILKADHLRTLAAMEEADLARFEPYLGLDPEIERQGEQMPLFG
jgi:hypothetical protein